MGVTIESAYLGDERSRTSVLQSLRSYMSSDGSISVPVNSGLIPILQVGGKIELTDKEVKKARDMAEDACGGATDKTCIDVKQQAFQRQLLDEKEQQSQSTANIIKGRKLTVTVVDETGKRKTFEVPEGQTFEYGKPKSSPPLKLEKSFFPSFTFGSFTFMIVKYIATFAGTILYVASVFITYNTFKQEQYITGKYIATALSIVFPFIGFFGAFGYLALRTWIQNIPTPR